MAYVTLAIGLRRAAQRRRSEGSRSREPFAQFDPPTSGLTFGT